MNVKNKKVIVVGGGLGGLSIAALLAKEGAKVTILEKNDSVGGRANILEEKGYIFDIGPSWYLMPDVFENFFKEFGKKPTNYFNLVKLSPSYRIFTEQKEIIDIPANEPDLYRLFDSIEPNGASKLKKYLNEAKEKYEISIRDFVYKSYRSLFDFFNLKMLQSSRKLTIFKSLEKYVEENFETDLARKILQYSVIFLGASPKNAPALYSLISYADLCLGVFYPMGGIYEITKAIKSICEEYGVEIKLNEPVKKVHIENGIASKVETIKNTYKTDIVIANADYQHFETELLEEQYRNIPTKSWDKKVLAPSAFIMFLGINKELPELDHHNFIWKNDWSEHFKTIFQTNELPKNPSIYICCPSRTDKSVAPEGRESVFVLIPSAVNVKDTPEVRKHYSNLVLEEIEKYMGISLRENIEVEKTFFINDFKSMFNAYKGTGLGLAHTLTQSAIFRPKNFSKKIKNLYYTGQYTNPGTGMPMVLVSSKIVFNEIISTQ